MHAIPASGRAARPGPGRRDVAPGHVVEVLAHGDEILPALLIAVCRRHHVVCRLRMRAAPRGYGFASAPSLEPILVRPVPIAPLISGHLVSCATARTDRHTDRLLIHSHLHREAPAAAIWRPTRAPIRPIIRPRPLRVRRLIPSRRVNPVDQLTESIRVPLVDLVGESQGLGNRIGSRRRRIVLRE